MKTIYMFIICSLFFNTFLYAQTNYIEGFIVKINGDTIKGYIDTRGDRKNSKEIDFKLSLAEKSTNYQPEDLRMYYISTGRSYFTRTVTIVNVNELKTQKKAFLQALEQGKADLYFFKDYDDAERFYLEKDSSLIELTNDKKIIDDNGTSRIFYNKRYLNIMNALFKDCASWNTNSDYKFEEPDLKKAVKKYNTCFIKDSKSIPNSETKKEKIKVGYIISAGINFTTVYEASFANWPLMRNPSARITPNFGIAINTIIPRINKNISFQLGLNYNQKGATAHRVESPLGSYSFNLHYIDLDLLIKYTYRKGAVRPFIGVGGVMGYLLNNNSAFKYDYEGNISPLEVYGNQLKESIEYGYCLEGGLFIPFKNAQKGIIIACRYEYTNMGFFPENGFYKNKVLQFKVGYKFK